MRHRAANERKLVIIPVSHISVLCMATTLRTYTTVPPVTPAYFTSTNGLWLVGEARLLCRALGCSVVWGSGAALEQGGRTMSLLVGEKRWSLVQRICTQLPRTPCTVQAIILRDARLGILCSRGGTYR